jgi:hypothetical protein
MASLDFRGKGKCAARGHCSRRSTGVTIVLLVVVVAVVVVMVVVVLVVLVMAAMKVFVLCRVLS